MGIWPKTFYQKKCLVIYIITPKKISNTIFKQVLDRAQLPDVLKFNVDKESKPYKSGGVTSNILSHPTVHWPGNLSQLTHIFSPRSLTGVELSADTRKIQSAIKQWVSQELLPKPPETGIFRDTVEGGLGQKKQEQQQISSKNARKSAHRCAR